MFVQYVEDPLMISSITKLLISPCKYSCIDLSIHLILQVHRTLIARAYTHEIYLAVFQAHALGLTWFALTESAVATEINVFVFLLLPLKHDMKQS